MTFDKLEKILIEEPLDERLDYIDDNFEDLRQLGKVDYPLSLIIILVLWAKLIGKDSLRNIREVIFMNKKMLENYFPILKEKIPSIQTISDILSFINHEALEELFINWYGEYQLKIEDKTINKKDKKANKIEDNLLSLDGKVQRGNRTEEQLPNHNVTAYFKRDGMSLKSVTVADKGGEIQAILEILGVLNIKGMIVTIDAGGTYDVIVESIIGGKANYVLAVKGNQPNLHEAIINGFNTIDLEQLRLEAEQQRNTILGWEANEITIGKNYFVKEERARGRIERREYIVINDIKPLKIDKKWKKAKTVIMTINSWRKEEEEYKEENQFTRYYLSSLEETAEKHSKLIRGHWSIESMHWHLDVTMKEDANKTKNKNTAKNLNIFNKWVLYILGKIDIGIKVSIKSKRELLVFRTEEILQLLLRL